MRDTEAEWMAAMRRGDFDAAWAISDSVIAARNPAARDDPAIPYHRRWVWNGAPIHGQNVLVRCYHGLGDTLQFVRFLPALRACAAAVTMESPARAHPAIGDMQRVWPDHSVSKGGSGSTLRMRHRNYGTCTRLAPSARGGTTSISVVAFRQSYARRGRPMLDRG